MTDQPFSTEQQEYLKGFMAGVEAKNGPLTGGSGASPDPTDLQRAAQDRTLASGGKLVPEEDAKRKKNPLDRFGEISALAGENKFPKGTDVFSDEVSRPVLRRPGAEQLHVPAAHAPAAS